MKRRLLSLVCLFCCAIGMSEAQTLVHYWNFNNSTDINTLLAPTISLVGQSSLSKQGTGTIVTTPIGDFTTGQGFETTNPNARSGDASSSHIRLNTPIGAILEFTLPTTGYKDIIIKYGTRRSGQGAGTQTIAYSTDGTSFTENYATVNPVDGNPTVATVDFSSLTTVNDNPNFKIRITFSATGGGTGGNNRFDNFTLEGTSTAGDLLAPTITFDPADQAINLATSVTPTLTFNEDIRLVSDAAITNANAASVLELKLNDQNGADVAFDATISGKVITVAPSSALQQGQKYYLAVKANAVEDLSNNAIASVQATTFTTIYTQTTFNPGDLVPLAYRMSAGSLADEFAFITFVDILPGTLIKITDSRYTGNAQPQCDDALTWMAPLTGVPSGTVISIKTDVPSVDKGTISGNNFGLSSGGDIVLMYTGTAASAYHITGLNSQGAWAVAGATCGGNTGMLPFTLDEGMSAINISALANKTNAFYSGTQTGTIASLRAAILNPANWTGSVAGTEQVWPSWAFPGPPVVTKAEVVNHNTIRVIFNRDMDNTSSTTAGHYTGIAGLSVSAMTSNGALADTVVLSFSGSFTSNTTYTLNIAGVKDSEDRMMLGSHAYTFTYSTKVSFDKAYLSVEENAGSVSIKLNIANPLTASLDLVLKTGAFNTAASTDFTYTTQAVSITGSDATKTITIPIVNDTEEEQDEYFVLSLENLTGCTLTGSQYITVYIRDNDRTAPQATRSIELDFVSRYTVNNPTEEEGLAEIVAYEPVSHRLFTMSTGLKRFDIVDFDDPENPVLIREVSVAAHGGGVTSIAVKNNIVAVSVPATTSEQDNGSILFYDTTGAFISKVTAGALPDMITFTPDGKYVMTANEGQPSNDYLNDPEGSITMVDITGGVANVTQANVSTLSFTAFNTQETALLAAGVRKTKLSSTLAQDFEPEYITVAADSKKAWVTLQENNAIAEINLETKTITSVWALGTKDIKAFGNGIDASDKNTSIHIANWPIKSFYMPDAVANYTVGNTTYLVTANEGDEKEYGGLNERVAIGHASVVLDPTVFPNAAVLKQEHNLGRFRITNLHGDTDSDGDYDALYSNGGRSFAIWNASTGALVYESGDDFEMITSEDPYTSPIFNADNGSNAFKGRSHAKGPEPEGVTIGKIGNNIFAFVTLERIGGVIVYDITDPNNVTFTDYKNSRSNTSFSGDNGPEGIIYISGQQTKNGKHYVISANEISGTLAIFEVLNTEDFITDAQTSRSEKTKFNLYPNPVRGGMVSFSQASSGALMDASGILIRSFASSITIDVSDLSKGLYMIRFENGEVKKLIVE